MAKNNRIETGIPGLDEVLLGGIPKGNLIVVEGPAGSGKTLLGAEFIYQGITQFGEPGIIVVFETSPDKMIRDAAALGWNLEELQGQNKLRSSPIFHRRAFPLQFIRHLVRIDQKMMR